MNKFSIFLKPISNTRPFKDTMLVNVYQYITTPKYAEKPTNTLRALAQGEARKAYKAANFNYATFSGTFRSRNAASLIEHSGLICIDLDHLADPRAVQLQLLNDPSFETQLLFTSPSGDGLKWIVDIDLSKATHEQWFQAISNYLLQRYGLQADKSGRDVCRACFLPYDPDCYINPRLLADVMEFDPTGKTADFISALNGEHIRVHELK